MYNFFVTGAAGSWDKSPYLIPKSRFLEYTTAEIADSLKSLGSEQIEALKSYPSLFAYEGSAGHAYFGRLKDIRHRGSSLLVEFLIDDSVRPIPFEKLYKIADLLDIREWEMNRTHWAVKDENLIARLTEANLFKERGRPNSKRVKQIISGFQNVPLQDLQVTRSPNITVESVEQFVSYLFKKQVQPNRQLFFRGHSDRLRYKLVPSLFRTDPKGNYLYLENEHLLCQELLISNPADFSSDRYTMDRLVRMQHYSMPTRLLDITSNPLIALYFAVKSHRLSSTGGEHEGEVLLLDVERSKIKYYDSDTASCVANLARLSEIERKSINFDLDIAEFNEQPAVARLVQFIREEKPYFERRVLPSDLRSVLCVKGKLSNDRISSQSGAFLLFGVDAMLDEEGNTEIGVDRVAVRKKDSLLAELDRLNINERTVFPYIENSAKYIAEMYRKRLPTLIED